MPVHQAHLAIAAAAEANRRFLDAEPGGPVRSSAFLGGAPTGTVERTVERADLHATARARAERAEDAAAQEARGKAEAERQRREAAARIVDSYELDPSGDDYSRKWNREALLRVVEPSADHEHWYKGHPGKPKFGLTVATARYFAPHLHSNEYGAERVLGAELILHGWHPNAGPGGSADYANPALAWLMGSTPNYKDLNSRVHAKLVERLDPHDPLAVRVTSTPIGEPSQIGYIMQLWVPDALARRRQLFPTLDPDPLNVFEPILYDAVSTILEKIPVPAGHARGLFAKWRTPDATSERTSTYLDEQLGPRGYRVRQFGLVSAPVRRDASADIPKVSMFDFLMEEGWIPVKFYEPYGRVYFDNSALAISRG